jgi:hypothetical protein
VTLAPVATQRLVLPKGQEAFADATTAQRYEVKFWATEEQASGLLRIATQHMTIDPFCRNGPQRNISLYLDSPGRTFFEQHLSGLPMRSKLRVRTYDDPTGPAFVEVKRRVKSVTMKHRLTVTRAIGRELAAGRFEAAAELPPSRDLMEFMYLHQRHMVEPVLLIAARRLALKSIGDNGQFRLTLDRDIEYQRPMGCDLQGRPDGWIPVDLSVRSGHEVLRSLFEMKFANAAPAWLAPAIEMLGLRHTSFSKYVAAMSQNAESEDGWNPTRGREDDDPEGEGE